MKSDLTCPVEVVHVAIQRETEDTNENGQILCLIDFFNLSDKVIDSIQMNIICFDAQGGLCARARTANREKTSPAHLRLSTWKTSRG